ncbi:MAG: HNH endonuclease [Thermoplasmatales archaeon]|nr:HNH endonuclease [Thermoplasmatales archaeon]
MSAKYFDNDKLYLRWVAKNKNGYVLNINANNNPEYRVLHSAKCYSVTNYQSDKPDGAFAERGYRKVCANSFQEIMNWVRENGGGHIRLHLGTSGCQVETSVTLPIDVPAGMQKYHDFPDVIQSPKTVTEGAKKIAVVNKYERDTAAREKCISKWGIKCSVCDFSFDEKYGQLGQGFIHVHHLKPLSEIGREYKLNPVKDLRPVCPNCHAMIHRSGQTISIEEMKKVIQLASKT